MWKAKKPLEFIISSTSELNLRSLSDRGSLKLLLSFILEKEQEKI